MKRTAAPQIPGGAGQKGPSPAPKKLAPADVSNGKTSSAPLTYPGAEPADDVNMNEVAAVEEKVTLEVVLPSGSCTSVTVDSNIPMLDLLVHVAGRCKVSPVAHELHVRDEETGKVVEFKPNQTVGSLGTTSVHLLPKNRRPEWSQAAKAAGKASMAFEITQRFTINLPGGQKAVLRVSPQMTLGQLLAKVCHDKSLDTARYTLRHPTPPHPPLPLTHTIAHTKLSEINLVYADNVGTGGTAAGAAPRAPALTASVAPASASASQDPASWYMPGAGETKKKKGFLSFLSKKEKKFKLDSHHNMETSSIASSHKSTSALPRTPRSTTPPPPSDPSSRTAPRRPHTMYVTSPSPGDPQLRGSSPGSLRADNPARNSSPQFSAKNSPKEPHTGASSSQERGADPKAPPRGAAGGGGKKRPAPPPPQAKTAAEEQVMKATSAAPVASAPAPSSKKQHAPSTEMGATAAAAAAASPVAASAEVSVVVSAPGTTVSSSSTSSASPKVAGGAAAADVNSASTANAGSGLLHSRNSSDSSGYHELTLSGAESPEASHHHLPTAFKTSIDTTSIDSGDNLGNGDSGIQDVSSPEEQQQQQQGSSRADLSKPYGVSGQGGDGSRTLPSSSKKKKAPPPPSKAKPAPVQEETSEVAGNEADDSRVSIPPPAPTEEVTSERSGAAPVSMKLNLDFLEESDDTETERTDGESSDRRTPDSATAAAAAAGGERKERGEEGEGEGGAQLTASSVADSEAFDLDDILNSVVFDEEPLGISKPNTPRVADDVHHRNQDQNEAEDSREMMMMETASIVSEVAEAAPVVMHEGVRARPCEFIAPPPPDEPPPEDFSPRGSGPRRSYADKSTVVGEDNVSLAPASLKGSPVSRERVSSAEARTGSDDLPSDSTESSPRGGDSLGQVTEPATLVKEETTDVLQQERGAGDDLQLTLAGSGDRLPPEEASTSVESHQEDSTMPLMENSAFAMTEEISAPMETVPPPLQFQTEEDDKAEEKEEEEEEVVTVTEEYIIPVAPGGALDFSAAVKVSELEEKEKKKKSSGVENDSGSSSRVDADSRDNASLGEGSQSRQRESQSDTTVSAVHQDFVGSAKRREDSATGIIQGVREEEERRQKDVLRPKETEVISANMAPWQSFVESAKKREESATSFRGTERGEGQKEAAGQGISLEKQEKPKPKPAEKEEFVLTLEDLNNVSLVPLRPKKYTPHRPTPAPVPVKEQQQHQQEVVRDEGSESPQRRRHLHLAYVSDHGHVQPARSSSSTSYHQSFAPHHHLPAKEPSSFSSASSSSSPRASSPAASPRQNLEPSRGRESSSDAGSSEHRYRATARLTMTPEVTALPALQEGGGQARSRTAATTATAARDTPPASQPLALPSQGGVGSAADLQQQYSSLQEQFSVWQQQLQQNQSLLASQDRVPGGGGGGSGGSAAAPTSEDTLRTLQMQMQMQQQMMEQLQRSMQALTLQQPQQHTAASTASTSHPPSTGMQVTVTPPSPAPPAPPAPAPAPVKSAARAPARKGNTQPLSSRFQPQLDPREELMIAIRSFGGISGLNTVPVSDTRWASDRH